MNMHRIRNVLFTGLSSVLLAACGGGGGGGGGAVDPTTTNTTTTSTTVLDGVVAPLYATATNWNDYVRASDTITACDGTEMGGYNACIHGGEHMSVSVTDKSSCAGLTAQDALAAFSWSCDSSTNPVRMVSSALKDGKNLSDLLDFTTASWRTNRVTVYDNGVAYLQSADATWWSNPVQLANSGGTLSSAGTVYVVTVANPGANYILGASKVGLVIDPAITLQGAGFPSDVIFANTQNFLWVEGTINASGDTTGVHFATTGFSVLRALHVSNAVDDGILLRGAFCSRADDLQGNANGRNGVWLNVASTDNTLRQLQATNNGQIGLYVINASNGNYFESVNVANNTSHGVQIGAAGLAADGNTLYKVRSTNNGAHGVYVTSSNSNSLVGVNTSNNTSHGFYVLSSTDTRLSLVTASSNGGDGFNISDSTNNVVSYATVANNYAQGINFTLSSHNGSLLNSFTANHATIGISTVLSNNMTFSNIAAAHESTGVYLFSSSNNIFDGLLKVGSNTYDCVVGGTSTNPGLDNACTSAATLSTGIMLTGSVVGKASVDTVNTNGATGAESYANITDWLNFENVYRGWGNDGSAFPNADHRSQCLSGQTCRIWDWTLLAGDTGDNGSPVAFDVLALPGGSDTLTQTWSDASTTTYLRNAVEIPGDGIGNDDGLCESGETCLYGPNLGGYQGHGNVVSAGTFVDGTITGVTLLKYSSNGY